VLKVLPVFEGKALPVHRCPKQLDEVYFIIGLGARKVVPRTRSHAASVEGFAGDAKGL
jgi:hypothetical protein